MENTNWPNLEEEKRKVRFLYVEAGEDHVHQQRGNKKYVYRSMKDWVEAYFDTIESNDHTQAELKRFAACKTYILGNWDSIQNRNIKGYLECSAEGHISHVLSHRLSSRPLSWCKNGSETRAKLRVYTCNGGSILGLLNFTKACELETEAVVALKQNTMKKKKKYMKISQAISPYSTLE